MPNLKKNEEICENVILDSRNRNCFIEVAKSTLNIDLCKVNKFVGYEGDVRQDIIMYDEWCVTYIGVKINDNNICDIYINDLELDEYNANNFFNICYNLLAYKMCDVSLCDKLGSGNEQNCISGVNENILCS